MYWAFLLFKRYSSMELIWHVYIVANSINLIYFFDWLVSFYNRTALYGFIWKLIHVQFSLSIRFKVLQVPEIDWLSVAHFKPSELWRSLNPTCCVDLLNKVPLVEPTKFSCPLSIDLFSHVDSRWQVDWVFPHPVVPGPKILEPGVHIVDLIHVIHHWLLERLAIFKFRVIVFW
jgi:hypothetical protein